MSYHDDDPWRLCEVNSYPDGIRLTTLVMSCSRLSRLAGLLLYATQHVMVILIFDLNTELDPIVKNSR